MNSSNSDIFRTEQAGKPVDVWAASLSTDELERELINGVKELLIKCTDRLLLQVQALNREYERRDCTLFPESVTPLPFEGASTLLAYAAQCVRDWEVTHKGRNTLAPGELDKLGAWHFDNSSKLPKARE